MNNSPIIRHADLSKMTDQQLQIELLYCYSACQSAGARVQEAIHNIRTHRPNPIPVWRLHEDYQIHTERLQAIIEEIQYRQIP